MKPKIRLLAKTTIWSAFATAAYFSASSIVTISLYQYKDLDIERYVQENLEQIIEEQEEKIGITYPAERPKIEYVLPEDYIFPGLLGLYNDLEDTIYLPSGLLTKPKWDLGDFMVTITTFNNTADAKRILDHELTHFYCDKLKEKAWGKNYPDAFMPEEELIANQLINEGIAEYVENTMDGEDEKAFPLEKWPSKIEDFSNQIIYQGGYAMVKPIIDKHKEKGIQFLLFNPPNEKELFKPKEYQERILNDIAKLQ